MITIQKDSDCLRCAHDCRVYQPSTDSEREALRCDEFKFVPYAIQTGRANCDRFKESGDAPIISFA
jgi:hypothetical protein